MTKMLVLATKNPGKIREINTLLAPYEARLKSLADFGELPGAVEDGASFAENACKKALYYARALGLPCLADDSGLCVPVLGGAPGVLSARYSGGGDAENCAKLLAALNGVANRLAYFACVLALAAPDGAALTWEGRCDGEILTEKRGDSGFGYDPLFFSPAVGKTFAEMSLAQKSSVSHRGKALKAFTADFARVEAWLGQHAGRW